MAEKRLIDANVLIELVADDLWAYEVEQFEHYVSKTPTVDAVKQVCHTIPLMVSARGAMTRIAF